MQSREFWTKFRFINTLSNFSLCASQRCDKGTSGPGVVLHYEHHHEDLLHQRIVPLSAHPQSLES